MRFACILVCLVFGMAGLGPGPVPAAAQSDLDTFMAQVLARRDENWKKQQQYVLDERDTLDVRGPARITLWGEQRDYTWFIRDGFFVRSPLKVNGVTVGEADRRKAEAEYLKEEKEHQEREAKRQQEGGTAAAEPPIEAGASGPGDMDAILRQTTRPGFISSAYFLRFRFDGGRYAFVGRETLNGRQVLRIEYYPTKLLFDEERDRNDERRKRTEKDKADDQVILKAMNKGSKVTLWIEPERQQILKYVFDDLNWDFFPGRWLLSLSNVQATMSVSEMFPEVWLPDQLEMRVAMSTAAGPMDFHFDVDYHDYRLPEVETRIGVPGAR